MNNKLISKDYLGSIINFEVRNGVVMANATEMAKANGKLFADWSRTKQAQEYIDAVSFTMGIPIVDLIEVNNGGNDRGSWIHQELVIEFARWCNVKFSLWCNKIIAELLREGKVSIQPQTKLDWILEAARIEKERMILEEKNEQLLIQERENAPRVAFAETIEKSSDSILIREMSKILGNEGINIGEKKLYDWLRSKGLVIKKGTEPTQTAITKEYFTVKERVIQTVKGPLNKFTTKITGKGQVYILETLKKDIQTLKLN